jgi:hypothetical protein
LREEAQDWQSCGDVNNANYDILLSDKKIVLAVEGPEPFFDKILRQTLGENALYSGLCQCNKEKLTFQTAIESLTYIHWHI